MTVLTEGRGELWSDKVRAVSDDRLARLWCGVLRTVLGEQTRSRPH